MAELDNDDRVGHNVAPAKVAAHTAQLAARTTKDYVPYSLVAGKLGALAARAKEVGKELHLILAGCNTVGLVSHLHKATPDPCRSHVWVVCTNEVWPSDVAPFLWHHYPGLVKVGDLDEYRAATRKLLGEYTEHYNRQRVQDDALREARAGRAAEHGIDDSLANAARCDRLDKVRIVEGDVADVSLM